MVAVMNPKEFATYLWVLTFSLNTQVTKKSTNTPEAPTTENIINLVTNSWFKSMAKYLCCFGANIKIICSTYIPKIEELEKMLTEKVLLQGHVLSLNACSVALLQYGYNI